jgi:hypothetical protein
MSLRDNPELLLRHRRIEFTVDYLIEIEQVEGGLRATLTEQPHDDILFTWMIAPVPEGAVKIANFIQEILYDLDLATYEFGLEISRVEVRRGALPLVSATEHIFNNLEAAKGREERISVRKLNLIVAFKEVLEIDTLVIHCHKARAS